MLCCLRYDMDKIAGFDFGREVSAEEVFDTWRRNEALDPGWQQCAQDHGYASWEEWRRHRFHVLGGSKGPWFRFRIPKPLVAVPTFFGGPSKTWIAHHYGKNALVRFSDFVKPENFQNNGKIQDLLKCFPAETEITGLVASNNDIVIIEGTHRCVALTIASMEKIPIETKLYILMTEWSEPDFPVPDPAPAGPKRVSLDHATTKTAQR